MIITNFNKIVPTFITLFFLVSTSLCKVTIKETAETKIIIHNPSEQSVLYNGFRSLIIPGWGNPKRASLYRGIEIGGIIGCAAGFSMTVQGDEGEALIGIGLLLLSGYTLGANHLVSSIDAMITTDKLNKDPIRKYYTYISPTYEPKKNRFGIGFTINF